MKKELPPWAWGSVIGAGVIALGLIDWLTGYELNFFVFYFLPVSLGAWFLGLGAAVTLSVLCALVWFGADVLSGHVHSSALYAVWNTIIRLVSFLAMGWSIARIRQLLDRERETTEALSRSLSEIKVLEAFLPVCAECKKIRDKEGHWQPFETYFAVHANTQFSHGFCPECAQKVIAEAHLADKPAE